MARSARANVPGDRQLLKLCAEHLIGKPPEHEGKETVLAGALQILYEKRLAGLAGRAPDAGQGRLQMLELVQVSVPGKAGTIPLIPTPKQLEPFTGPESFGEGGQEAPLLGRHPDGQVDPRGDADLLAAALD